MVDKYRTFRQFPTTLLDYFFSLHCLQMLVFQRFNKHSEKKFAAYLSVPLSLHQFF